MQTNRRRFIAAALAGGTAAAVLPNPARAQFLNAPRHGLPGTLSERFTRLDAILKEPVFNRSLFPDPVVIQSVELLRNKKEYLCRIRSQDGREGISVSNAQQMDALYPIFVKRIAPFFIGKDARDIEQLIPAVTVYESNYKAQGLAIWVPIATVEFAILDMFGKMSGRPIGMLISDKIYNHSISVYQANGERDITAE